MIDGRTIGTFPFSKLLNAMETMVNEKIIKTLARQPKLTPDLIQTICKKRANIDVHVRPKSMGNCRGFEVSSEGSIVYVTDRPISYYTKKYHRVTNMQSRSIEIATPMPLYLGQGDLDKALFDIYNSKNPKESVNKWLLDIFSIDVATAYFNKYLSASNCFKEYKTIIFEAIEAFYMGMDHIAIMSLIPVLEAGLRNVQESTLNMNTGNVSAKEFERGLKLQILTWGRRSVESYSWYPGKGYNTEVEIDFFTQINPQCDVINAFRVYFNQVLYKSSSAESQGFNRHLIVHLLMNNFNEPSNFIRIFLALTNVAFIESLYNQDIPFMWQGIDDKDRSLGNYIRSVSKEFGDPRCKLLNKLGISNYDLDV
ncbi:hypothetical protein [Vibrio sp. CK2-1]|uniref:hypothetical protein n=1 Tax=Vibrio sp. CK2-1 TaxID=2912249 RepID=UPI001F3C91CA|nr:hypothetical protein [Vibrio sp. CK2-1]MCF7354806.1 hypothetical protein [Vibrio sp. CK2-1]